MTNESKALINLFHGRTECKKNKYGKSEKQLKWVYIVRQSSKHPALSDYRTIGVIGSGVIGAGIAHISIDKDFQVILHDTTLNELSHGQSQIVKGYENYMKRNRITK
jgi:enoyl-CoA hydratase/long-chain 3-hydroxyacyl-CoA dehydrogenase